jgi:hypothetical protein
VENVTILPGTVVGLSFSELREQLKFEGLTASQVDYAMADYSKY